MKTYARALAAACPLLLLAACSSGPSDAAPPSPPAVSGDLPLVTTTVETANGAKQVQAPEGWTVTEWARVPSARLLAWTPDERLLVSRPKNGDVLVVSPEAQTTLVDGLNQPHGLAFAGDTLYVAESDQVISFAYRDGTVSDRKVVIGGLPDAKSPDLGGQYAHALKSVAVGTDGTLYVSVGSTGNVSAEDRDADPERATILKAPAGGGTPEMFARGVRNGTGLAIDPDGAVWTAVNNRDNVEYPYDRDYDGDGETDRGAVLQAYVNDHPIEPLARLTQGRDLGWPYCNPDPDVRPGDPDSPLTYSDRPFVGDLANNPDGTKLDCATLPPVEQGMGAHSAPLGLSFTSGDLPGGYGRGALVGVHGSWNRRPPRAPEVSFFAWRDGTLGPQQTLLGGFQADDGSRWGRPVMAVQGPDGSIYVSDDMAGAIYRVTPP